MKKLSKDQKLSERSMRIIKDDLKMNSYALQKRQLYALQKRQLLSAPQKTKRLQRCKFILDEIQYGIAGEVVWSDEKMFTIEQCAEK